MGYLFYKNFFFSGESITITALYVKEMMTRDIVHRENSHQLLITVSNVGCPSKLPDASFQEVQIKN